jgi:hypothetical protein
MQPDIAPVCFVKKVIKKIFFKEMFIGQKYLKKFARM